MQKSSKFKPKALKESSTDLLKLIPLPTQDITTLFNLTSSLTLSRPNLLKNPSPNNPALNTNTLLLPLDHLTPNTRLNSKHKLNIPLPDKRNSLTTPASTSRTTNTMNVIIRVAWHIEVNNQAYRRNIETTRCNVRSDEDARSRCAERARFDVRSDCGRMLCREVTRWPRRRSVRSRRSACVGVIAEDDHRFGDVFFCGEEDVEEGFAVRHWDLEVGLFKGRGDVALVFGSRFRLRRWAACSPAGGMYFSRRTSAVMVAVKSRVWRSVVGGSAARQVSTSGSCFLFRWLGVGLLHPARPSSRAGVRQWCLRRMS